MLLVLKQRPLQRLSESYGAKNRHLSTSTLQKAQMSGVSTDDLALPLDVCNHMSARARHYAGQCQKVVARLHGRQRRRQLSMTALQKPHLNKTRRRREPFSAGASIKVRPS
eukprot:6212273-Pleurochrysis_carterae.AAC.4